MSLYRFICLLFIIFTTSLLRSQCLQVEVQEDYVPTRSDLIIEGIVTDRVAKWNEDRSLILTEYTVSIYKILKGNPATTSISIVAEGGQLGEVMHLVTPQIALSVGDVGVFMLAAISDSPTYKAWAVDQSVYVYDRISGTTTDDFKTYDLRKQLLTDRIAALLGSDITVIQDFDALLWIDNHNSNTDSRSVSTIMSFTPSTIRAGVDDVLTINGTNFGSSPGQVQFRNANSTSANSYVTNPSIHIVSWSDTEIKVRVAAGAGTGKVRVNPATGPIQTSATNLVVSYNILSFTSTPTETYVRYVSNTSVGNINYQYNTSFAANTSATSSFGRAMSTWKCNTGINWTNGNNTTVNNSTSDGISVIRWSSGEITYPVLGRYNGYFFASGGNTEWCAAEFDIMFLPDGQGVTWHYGAGPPTNGTSDFESTALHELGHALIMGHVSDPSAVMYPSSTTGTTNRTPDTDAINGALFSMPLHQSFPSSCSSNFALTPATAPVVSNSNAAGAGSLRQAVMEVCDDNSITFAPALAGSTISLGGTPIEITKNSSIVGLGATQLTLSGNNLSRIFTIEPNIEFTLSDIRLLNGQESTNGGAFYNQGLTTLQDVILEGNKEGSTSKAFSNEPGKSVMIQGQVEVRE